METLGNEALGKILNLVDEAGLLAELHVGRGTRRPQTSVLNVLSNAHIGTYRARTTGCTPPADDVILTVLCLSQSWSTRTDSGSRVQSRSHPHR